MLPIQFGINAQLASWVGSLVRATSVSFAVGAAVLLVAMLLFARSWPGTEKLGGAPWWVWVGGCFGAFHVLGSVVTAEARRRRPVRVHPRRPGGRVTRGRPLRLGRLDESPDTPGRLLGLALVAAGVAAARFLEPRNRLLLDAVRSRNGAVLAK